MKKFLCIALLLAAPHVFAQDDNPPDDNAAPGAPSAEQDSAQDSVQPDQQNAAPEAPAQPASQLVNAQAGQVFSILSKPGENLVFSPYSLAVAMGMAYEGARTTTADQIAAAMGFGAQEDIRAGFADITSVLADNSGDNKFLSANSFWANKNFIFLPEYMQTLSESYHAEAHYFDKNPVREINSWVALRTEQMIDRILAPEDVDSLTGLLLLNTVYFKGKWEKPFNKEATQPAFFRGAAGDYLVPMMHMSEDCDYADKDSYQAMKKDYRGGDYSLVVLLPRNSNGLEDLELDISSTGFDGLADGFQKTAMDIYLPRFESESTMDLIPALKEMGITDAFGKTADFSGISSDADGPFYIKLMRQKARIKTDEEGTEAAAATAVELQGEGVAERQQRPVLFRADHPFVYLLVHNPTGAILFAGEYGKKKLEIYRAGEVTPEQEQRAREASEKEAAAAKHAQALQKTCEGCIDANKGAGTCAMALQGFPGEDSAIISGQNYHKGDTVLDAKITALDFDSATVTLDCKGSKITLVMYGD